VGHFSPEWVSGSELEGDQSITIAPILYLAPLSIQRITYSAGQRISGDPSQRFFVRTDGPSSEEPIGGLERHNPFWF